MREIPVVLALVAFVLAGCEGRGDAPRASTAQAECPMGEAQKLGVPFVPLCDPEGSRGEPGWISAAPLSCTGGAHEVVGCPPGTALIATPPTTRTRQARGIALMEGETAFRTCALRFGGRLPTAAERARARRVQGLVTLVASRRLPDGSIDLDEIPEWVADGRCDNPSKVGADCAVRRAPVDAEPNLPWAELLRCDVVAGAGTTRTDHAVAELGGTCPARGDCLIRSPATTREDVVTLSCAFAPVERYPADSAALGAVRCVVPRNALTRL